MRFYTEPGRMEAKLARGVQEHDSGCRSCEGKEDTAAEKDRPGWSAGIKVAAEISEIPELVKQRIGAAL